MRARVEMAGAESCARTLRTSVGVEMRKVARPPMAPAVKTAGRLGVVADAGVSSGSTRLYVVKRRALRAP